MNYKIIKVETDSYELQYKNAKNQFVTKPFKVDVEVGEILDSTTALARVKMAKYMAKLGITKDDLVIKTKDGKGNTTYNEQNYIDMEKEFVALESTEVLDRLIKKCFGMSTIDLFKDMGLDMENENNLSSEDQFKIQAFTQEFMLAITGRDKSETPRKQSTDDTKQDKK